MFRFFSFTINFIILATLFSCQKLDYDDGIVAFGEVYFDINAPALNEFLKIKYNESDIKMQTGTGMVKVPEGEGVFQFYDSRTNKILAEKKINIVPGSPEKFLLFQPTETSPFEILNPNEQENEEAAPDGYLKIKVANYANKALPYDRIDIRVEANDGWNGFFPIDTIISIDRNLENAEYHLVRKGENIISYRFSYIVNETQQEVLNARGTLYTSGGVWNYPKPKKDVFTIFLSETFEAELEGASNAAKGRGVLVDGLYIYRISPYILFAN